MSLAVDLNADLGENAGHDDELLALISSANIACGFHAGDAATMRAAIVAAQRHGVAVGAHPSFFDRQNFGRKELPVAAQEITDAVHYQIGVFQAIADGVGARVLHVKPHGALYNMGARDLTVADAIVHGISKADSTLILFAPGGSALSQSAAVSGLEVVSEVFADRNYLKDGSLVPRTRPDALLTEPEEAALRVVRMLRQGKVESVDGGDVEVRAESVCVHGDTSNAVEFARAVRQTLERNGVAIRAPTAGRGQA